jgi:hypothetical protein
MFQSALIRRQISGPTSVDAGAIAETLLFYNRVHVVADKGLLSDLIAAIGLDNFVTLVSDHRLSVSYSRSLPAVVTNTINHVPKHLFTAITVHAHADRRKAQNVDDVAEAIERSTKRGRKTKAATTRLMDSFRFRTVGPRDLRDAAVMAEQELSDPLYVRTAVKALIDNWVPSYRLPSTWDFRAAFADEGWFYIITDLDFGVINREYHKLTSPEHSSISPEYILAFLQDARVDIDLAADYMSELVTRPEVSELIRLKIARMLARRDSNSRQIASFQEVHLGDARAIREAINSGERNFSEFLHVLDKADRFREWLAERNPDAQLLTEYYNAVTADSWVGTLRAKSLRYITTAVVGIASPVMGLLASAADELVVDRILRGWRPNQFVEGQLRKFTSVE